MESNKNIFYNIRLNLPENIVKFVKLYCIENDLNISSFYENLVINFYNSDKKRN